ncbi:YolD-like family protein [Fictibacillus nanhaiensis]|uniref:YolD-like family protein n=1 Tax=Fictibacillus nanhaiensis TaxID=742169 RepID=UPI003C14CC07
MIRDRGTIKWTAMMLPEHVKMLREHQDGLDYGRKPELDEQKYEEFNETICMAMEENQALKFTYFEKGRALVTIGHVHYIDEYKKELRVLNEEKKMHILKVIDIMDVEYA